ncbi:MAG: cytidine deaminase [Candidatus Njordarchaeia archaeon]
MDTDELVEYAKKASENAYAPYSKFRVGAALLTKDGKVFTGCNIENASYGLTICAERVALFKAVSEGYREFEAIAIYAEKNMPYPCGACRQVLAEFVDKKFLFIISDGEHVETYTFAELLPHSFSFR